MERSAELVSKNDSCIDVALGNEPEDVKLPTLKVQKISEPIFSNPLVVTLFTRTLLPDSFTFRNPYTLVLRRGSLSKSKGEPQRRNLVDKNKAITTKTKTASPQHVRLAKFCIISYINLLLLHKYIRWRNYEHDESLTLEALHTYDFHSVALDLLVFFFVGRMYDRDGIDTLNFQLPVMFGGWFFSAMTEWDWARYNVSYYQIKCRWPTELFVFAGFTLFLCTLILMLHIKRGWDDGILVSRLIELTATFVVFCVPTATDPFYHFHHWFACWLVGMHANHKYWWSRATMALFWGVYLNGIAGYGRDSILGCKSAYYNSVQQKCGMLREDEITTDWRVETWCYYQNLPVDVTLNGTVNQFENETEHTGDKYLGFGDYTHKTC